MSMVAAGFTNTPDAGKIELYANSFSTRHSPIQVPCIKPRVPVEGSRIPSALALALSQLKGKPETQYVFYPCTAVKIMRGASGYRP
jgi:hypothetical protein